MNHSVKDSMNQWNNEATKQWINDPRDQWNNDSMNQRISAYNQWTNDSVNQRISESAHQWTHEPVNQPTNQSMRQKSKNEWISVSMSQWSADQWIIASMNQWMNEWTNKWMKEWWMAGWVTCVCELLLHWATSSRLSATSSLSSHFSYLGYFCSDLPFSYSSAAVTMGFATSSYNPACQAARGVAESLMLCCA